MNNQYQFEASEAGALKKFSSPCLLLGIFFKLLLIIEQSHVLVQRLKAARLYKFKMWMRRRIHMKTSRE